MDTMCLVCHSELTKTGRKPNVVTEWLTFLLRIREFPSSNLGPEIVNTDWSFRRSNLVK
jgi:hypothetical protein